VNAAALGLGVPVDEKLGWLALDSVIERGRRVRECIERRLRADLPPHAPRGGELN
jgi:hypothetical protein